MVRRGSKRKGAEVSRNVEEGPPQKKCRGKEHPAKSKTLKRRRRR